MKVLIKLNQARAKVKTSNLKKEGRHTFSKYDYYTPEQVNKLVWSACEGLELFNKFSLIRTDLGLMAHLEVVDLESGERESFEIATEIPEIKATNIAQQLGGTVTYSERYLLMIAYDIKDNNLDFDSKEHKEETKEEKPWMSDKLFTHALEKIKLRAPVDIKDVGILNIEEFYQHLKDNYRMKKKYADDLKAEFELELNKALQ